MTSYVVSARRYLLHRSVRHVSRRLQRAHVSRQFVRVKRLTCSRPCAGMSTSNRTGARSRVESVWRRIGMAIANAYAVIYRVSSRDAAPAMRCGRCGAGDAVRAMRCARCGVAPSARGNAEGVRQCQPRVAATLGNRRPHPTHNAESVGYRAPTPR